MRVYVEIGWGFEGGAERMSARWAVEVPARPLTPLARGKDGGS